MFSHFDGVRLMSDVVAATAGRAVSRRLGRRASRDRRRVDVLAALRSRRDERGVPAHTARVWRRLGRDRAATRQRLWRTLLARYPTIGARFADATPLMPIAFRPRIQHRLTRAAGERWAMLPHAYAFVDPLFSTGIAWGLRAVERLALAFEQR